MRDLARKLSRRAGAVVRWRQRLNAWEERRFDRRLCVDTRGAYTPTRSDVHAGDAAHGHAYVATQPRLAHWWLSALPTERHELTFIDMGSGKGRVLLLAAQAGFSRCLGIEYAESLHRTALANAVAARRKGLEIEPILCDAATFRFPSDPLVVYFSNPFAEQVMASVIVNLVESYAASPRRVVVVYEQLAHEPLTDSTRNAELLDEVEFLSARDLELPRKPVSRRFLEPFSVRLYESAEVRARR